MAKYYDEKCLLCEGCHFWGRGNYPDGREYESCQRYGYILHLDKGVSLEECEGFRTEAQWRYEEQQRELLKKKHNGTARSNNQA